MTLSWAEIGWGGGKFAPEPGHPVPPALLDAKGGQLVLRPSSHPLCPIGLVVTRSVTCLFVRTMDYGQPMKT